MTKKYIGDSVYAEKEYCDIILTTENDSSGPSNKIVLDPATFGQLVLFAIENDLCKDYFKDLL